jgi:hypothetical protein
MFSQPSTKFQPISWKLSCRDSDYELRAREQRVPDKRTAVSSPHTCRLAVVPSNFTHRRPAKTNFKMATIVLVVSRCLTNVTRIFAATKLVKGSDFKLKNSTRCGDADGDDQTLTQTLRSTASSGARRQPADLLPRSVSLALYFGISRSPSTHQQRAGPARHRNSCNILKFSNTTTALIRWFGMNTDLFLQWLEQE